MCLNKFQFCVMLAHPEILFCGEAKDWFYLRRGLWEELSGCWGWQDEVLSPPTPPHQYWWNDKRWYQQNFKNLPKWTRKETKRGHFRDLWGENKKASHIVGLSRLVFPVITMESWIKSIWALFFLTNVCKYTIIPRLEVLKANDFLNRNISDQ